jgi:hypothetical protein
MGSKPEFIVTFIRLDQAVSTSLKQLLKENISGIQHVNTQWLRHEMA